MDANHDTITWKTHAAESARTVTHLYPDRNGDTPDHYLDGPVCWCQFEIWVPCDSCGGYPESADCWKCDKGWINVPYYVDGPVIIIHDAGSLSVQE